MKRRFFRLAPILFIGSVVFSIFWSVEVFCNTDELVEEEWVFVSCAWSPQECSYSCSNRKSVRAEYDPQRCEMEYWGLEWACYCLSGEAGGPG